MAGALGPRVYQATVVRRQVFQQWQAALVDVLLGADHQAVPELEAPDASRDSGIHVVHAFGLDSSAVLEGDLPVGVAAVDDDVPGVAELDELVDRLGGGVAGRDHDPHDAGPVLEFLDELFPGARADRSLVGVALDSFRREVERDHPVSSLQKAQHHVAAHAAEADHPHFHCYLTADLAAATSARQPAAGSRPRVTLNTGNRRDVSD